MVLQHPTLSLGRHASNCCQVSVCVCVYTHIHLSKSVLPLALPLAQQVINNETLWKIILANRWYIAKFIVIKSVKFYFKYYIFVFSIVADLCWKRNGKEKVKHNPSAIPRHFHFLCAWELKLPSSVNETLPPMNSQMCHIKQGRKGTKIFL